MLTDGRANVARDGGGGRARAEAEALEAARALRAARVACVLVDASPRPAEAGRKLAAEMGAQIPGAALCRRRDALPCRQGRGAHDGRTHGRASGGRRPLGSRDGRDWPNRAASRFVTRRRPALARPGRRAQGPSLLLVHGTGAATHSWRDLLPLLARHFTVVAPDLPGHGFTERPRAAGLSLPGMARGVAALLRALGLRPALAAGHSAGAADPRPDDASMAASRRGRWSGSTPRCCPSSGWPARSSRRIARLLAGVPVVPWFFAWRAGDRGLVERLLRDTGSRARCARRRALRPAGAAARPCRRGARHDGALGPAAAAARPDAAGRARWCWWSAGMTAPCRPPTRAASAPPCRASASSTCRPRPPGA